LSPKTSHADRALHSLGAIGKTLSEADTPGIAGTGAALIVRLAWN